MGTFCRGKRLLKTGSMNNFLISIVISTIDRTEKLRFLLDSLARQTLAPHEIIIVDQNSDRRIADVVNDYEGHLPLKQIYTPGQKGVCRGRNIGWKSSSAELLLFPDDDCWYPFDFLERAVSILIRTGADIVSGRSADEAGRSINGRFEDRPCWVDRNTVWTTQIEWTALMRRVVLNATEGFNETLGPGSGTPWGGHEIQDLSIKAMKAGFKQYYDPELYAHHESMLTLHPDKKLRRKGRCYARGMGRVLRTNGYGIQHAVYWALRPLARIIEAILLVRLKCALYQKDVSMGRLEGYFADGS
jgi:glycosyltransferase involved in cell wall biosynthesis